MIHPSKHRIRQRNHNYIMRRIRATIRPANTSTRCYLTYLLIISSIIISVCDASWFGKGNPFLAPFLPRKSLSSTNEDETNQELSNLNPIETDNSLEKRTTIQQEESSDIQANDNVNEKIVEAKLTSNSESAQQENGTNSKHVNNHDDLDTGSTSVGVKEHSNNNNNNKKKSNAVGDPDGSDDDDSDDEDEFNEEWEELFNDIENEMKDLEETMKKKDKNQEIPGSDSDTSTTTAQVQLEVEYVTSDEENKNNKAKTIQSSHDNSNVPSPEIEFATVGTPSSSSSSSSSSPGGGIGLRLNQNGARDVLRRGGGGGEKDRKGKNNKIKTNRISKDDEEEIDQDEEEEYEEILEGPKSMQSAIVNAWQRHVFLPPPSPAMEFLQKNSRTIDSASKMRLDRRTLYATLLQEFEGTSITNRKYLDQPTSQALQAALSLASQPSWRKSVPRPCGIRLYNIPEQKQQQQSSSEGRTRGSTTLAMQETISMALAHSLGAGYVAIDDQTIKAIRAELINSGYVKTDDDIKPVTILKSLLSITNGGVLAKSRRLHSKRKVAKLSKIDDNTIKKSNRGNRNDNLVASITNLMKDDISSGIDDPFDERASSSCSDMAEWEETWYYYTKDDDKQASSNPKKHQSSDGEDNKLPLVIFLRTEACSSLLRSKSTVDYLVTECDSPDSVNLLVLGKGIGATTDTLPEEPTITESTSMGGSVPPQLSQTLPGAAPWFGFPPHNQNASGQNDPEGSRRFNIFLARTTDPVTGTPGIIGAIAPPQAGNLFPHMMAMQARSRLQQDDDDSSESNSPMRAELERWAEMLQQQMQSSNGNPLPPPQFFNASFTITTNSEDGQSQESATPPFPPVHLPPEVIQQTLEHAMSELLDRLSQMNDADTSGDMSPELQRAFSQVLRNESFRKGVAENLARAAPALSDPKCQGVLLSVYVPPPPQLNFNQGKSPAETTGQQQQQNDKLGGWFQKILNNQDDNDKNSRQKRVRTMAAAAAVMAAQNAQNAKDEKEATEENRPEDRVARNLARLESLCRPIIVKKPSDPVRAKSWEAWIGRERGSVIFRQNRRVLNEQLEKHQLSLQEHTGTRGAGSALRSMLSVRPITDEMEKVIECAIELEASKSQRLNKSPSQIHEGEMTLDVDITLSQLLITDNALIETEDVLPAKMVMEAAAQKRREEKSGVQFLHPSSLEAALTMICRISPAPSGGLSMTTRSSSGSATVTHRTREEIAALAQDKHERALISQVVSPQDIGVTYDMIGGLKEVKELLRQSITYPLKFPHLYSEGIARVAVKGVLLFGPPGTGKTMLAKAVATEGGASFLSVDASSVENKWLGESEKNAKAVFTLARRLAPCVIFIDEVDSLLSSRDGTSDDSAHGTLTSVKTTMMSEWDGLNSGTNGAGDAGSDRVVVIGSTNRPFDLDEAVLRRFPRRILVDLPDLETRAEILEVTLAENRVDPAVNLTKIAERLEGYTGSDIKEVCREAVVQISHEQAMLLDKGFSNSKEDITQGSLQRLRPVTNEDFEKALSKLKRSVSEKGRELARVWEWNDEYGEIKKEKKNYLPHLANMYL